MRVRVADADDLALVLEDEDERHVGMRRELAHLLLPRLEQGVHAIDVELRQRHVVPRAVADHARHTGRRTVPVDARRARQLARCGRADARVVVVEHERAGVAGVHGAAHARVARAEITRGIERRQAAAA